LAMLLKVYVTVPQRAIGRTGWAQLWKIQCQSAGRLGIAPTGDPHLVNPLGQFSDSYWEEFESEHSKREDLWLKGITGKNFESALFVCGFLHAFSVAAKLRLAGFEVGTWIYVPYSKLCPCGPHLE
jgi:hypothetical protein